jgi:peptidyl-prolyl cis-trans isomerase D
LLACFEIKLACKYFCQKLHLQKGYSRLYAQYNQMFQGNFDEEKAKQFGLQKQALQQLTQQALLLNLAKSYDLSVSDKELVSVIKTQEYFFKDGVFDKNTYKQVLSQNRLTTKEYENDLRKDILIQKMLKLLPVKTSKNEEKIVDTIFNIADKINYKVLTLNDIKIDTSDKALKPFWEKNAQNFMSDVSYNVKYIKQEKVAKEYNDKEISKYYNENRTHFKDAEGKILPLESAKDLVIKELNAGATKDKALRTYIAYKKGKLGNEININNAVISQSNNPFNEEVLEKISKLSLTSPYAKPILVDGVYYIFELVKINPSKAKSFEEAKAEVLPLYVQETKKSKLLELANNSLNNFNGNTTKFITINDANELSKLNSQEANEFLQKLFTSDKKRSFIALSNGNIILYDILEQKMLDNSNTKQGNTIAELKSAMFNKGLIETLQNKYHTEIFIEGL